MIKIKSVLFSIIVLLLTIAFFVSPRDNFSENENRSLADFPSFNIDDILTGEYMEDVTTYLADHFPFRDKFVELKNDFEIDFLNKKYVNNIFIAHNDWYIEDYLKPENTKKIIDNLNEFQDNLKGVKADFMLVPTQVSIYENELPKYSSPLSQLKTIDEYYSNLKMNNIDVYDTLMAHKNSEKLFYKLDHHWTTDGAYYAYVEYCKAKGFTPVDRSEYSVETVADFRGTVYSKINSDNIKNGEDIKVYNKPFNLTVSYDGKESNSLYNMDYANKKDKYSLFLNNINSFVEITNNDFKGERSIAIAKDSYANSMIPFLVNHYKKIYVFDTRSYKDSVSDFVNSHNIDDVLVLYNVNTIDSDTGLNAIY